MVEATSCSHLTSLCSLRVTRAARAQSMQSGHLGYSCSINHQSYTSGHLLAYHRLMRGCTTIARLPSISSHVSSSAYSRTTRHLTTRAYSSHAIGQHSLEGINLLNQLTPIASRYLRRLEKLDEETLSDDERVQKLGKAYHDEYSKLKAEYRTPKNPIVLCHGLLGFDSMRIGEIAPLSIPPLAVIHYWKGIKEALEANGNEVFITRVPRTATVEERAEILANQIQDHFGGRSVNLIGHSMGGMDCRYLISNMKPDCKILSLTTVATPHRGSPFADYCMEKIGKHRLPKLYRAFEKVGLQAGAFEQLTTDYAINEFNQKTPDDPNVKYFSYGSFFEPNYFSAFRAPWRIIHDKEGPNDGLVSVKSAIWGEYKGSISNSNHLDIINFANRIEYVLMSALWQQEPTFNAVSLYMEISDMLASEGF